jgi:hypothetical protein
MNNHFLTLHNHHSFIWCSSWMSLWSSMYAMKRGYYHLSIVPGCVFLTSINYWRDTSNNRNKKIDKYCVYSSLIYQLIMARNLTTYKQYCYITSAACLCYPIGILFYKYKYYWTSTITHSFVHLFGNVANVVLYSGKFI